ncbi:Ank repeat PF [Echinococcus multilocularis]|uniref:Ank repeat PF n=1 Tax=Echinococcus multilocularis TaxID=6211 RepID=A0A0S4MJM5_ECHMU|nr:Ank repeat PF [Echinococcus multilocularis]
MRSQSLQRTMGALSGSALNLIPFPRAPRDFYEGEIPGKGAEGLLTWSRGHAAQKNAEVKSPLCQRKIQIIIKKLFEKCVTLQKENVYLLASNEAPHQCILSCRASRPQRPKLGAVKRVPLLLFISSFLCKFSTRSNGYRPNMLARMRTENYDIESKNITNGVIEK